MEIKTKGTKQGLVMTFGGFKSGKDLKMALKVVKAIAKKMDEKKGK